MTQELSNLNLKGFKKNLLVVCAKFAACPRQLTTKVVCHVKAECCTSVSGQASQITAVREVLESAIPLLNASAKK